MRNANLKTWFAISIILVVTMAGPLFSEEPVYFADQNLKAAVEAYLVRTDPTPTDMLDLTYLDASYADITDLTGLEYATNLERLYLNNNQISNLTPLSGLTNLRNLGLWENPIVDISPVSGLTNLTGLWLGFTRISDISPISKLSNLTWFTLIYSNVRDVSPVSGLTNLKYLFLDNNWITNISAVSGLTNLTILGLRNNAISDIAPVSRLQNLETLYLEYNQIRDIGPVSGLINLTQLSLGGNDISDISPVGGLTGLEDLWLGGNQISDISPVAGLMNLTSLILGSNRIVDISWVSMLTKLTFLSFSYNEISDISVLSELSSIRWLSLEHNYVREISSLSALTNLTYLDLRSNPLNEEAYFTYLPVILTNNPGIDLRYETNPKALIWSAQAIGADKMHSGGITGKGIRVGDIESITADEHHEVFATGRLTNLTHSGIILPGDKPNHATEVAGVIGGNSLSYRGVAPATQLTVYNVGLLGLAYLVPAVEALVESQDIINVEIWKPGVPSSGADQGELSMDWAVQAKRLTVIVPVGNSGAKVELPAGGYNIISVGGTTDFRILSQQNIPVPLSALKSSNSNFGPTVDTGSGRCKPDIAAPGDSVPVADPNDRYGVNNGTSFAAPHVAGAAGLLIEHGRTLNWTTDPKLIKALLMTGAIKPIAWARSATLLSNGGDTWLETTQPLDFGLGAGLLNVARASAIYTAGKQPTRTPDVQTQRLGWDDGHLDFVTTPATYILGSPIDADSTITGTLVWNRNVQKGIWGYTAEQTDTLALILRRFDGNRWSPVASSLSTVDNIQYIFYRVPYSAAKAQYRLEVHYGSDRDSIAGCDYALAWYAEDNEAPPIENGFFSHGGFNGWTPSGIGMAEVVELQLCDGDPYAVKLTVGEGGTYRELSQVTTPLMFTDGLLEFGFKGQGDRLVIYRDDIPVDGFGLTDYIRHAAVRLHFDTLRETPRIAFRLEGPTGSNLLLDHIQLTPTPCASVLHGDIDKDCDVDFYDLKEIASYWLQKEQFVDIAPLSSGDGIVNLKDLAVLAEHWLEGTTP